MKCTAALACVLALAMLLTGCKKPVDTAAATAETAESAATDTPISIRKQVFPDIAYSTTHLTIFYRGIIIFCQMFPYI